MCRKAHLYLQICYGHAPECCSAEVPQYMRQAARSRIYAEIEASEPCSKAESGSQPTHNKRIAGLSVTVPVVQMQRQREASEPCIKAESSSQPTHNKCIAGLSATVPEVQIPDGVGRQQIANAPRRCFWLGVPQNVQQNSPGHLNRKETQKITATH